MECPCDKCKKKPNCPDRCYPKMDYLRHLRKKPKNEGGIMNIADHKAGVEYPCQDLYEWHHRLTGSCEMGRKQFAKDHGIDIDKDRMTVEQFCALTRDSYGGEIIRKIELKIKNNT